MVTSSALKSATRDGVKLSYLDTGSGEPALLFIHGWCCDQSTWRDQIKAFAPKHRIIAVDLRGHGESDKPDQDYDIAGFADDMAWLIRNIGLDRPVIIAHSMGGVTTLNLLRKHPDMARAAVFVDAGIMPLPEAMRPLIAQTIEGLKSPAYREVAANVVKQVLFREESPPELRDEVAAGMAEAPQRLMHTALVSTLSEENYPPGPVPIPSLFVKAATLQVTEEQIKERYPGMEVVSMDTGHFNHMEKAEEFNAILSRFLENVA
ncbi:MAG TPA: alpha/beta hydrolase [Dehalococcoidia bacterium]|nr:alpha/beta hydrolase [Dehalococcoidia bacterium]